MKFENSNFLYKNGKSPDLKDILPVKNSKLLHRCDMLAKDKPSIDEDNDRTECNQCEDEDENTDDEYKDGEE